MVPKAKYETICEDIKQLIRNGDIKPGGKIPSVSMIREKYDVSHVTALRGLKQLFNQNYMDFVKGKGYYAKLSRDFLEEKQFTRSIACFLRPYRPITRHDNYYNKINTAVQCECMQRGYTTCYPSCDILLNEHHPSENALEIIKNTIMELLGEVDGYIIDERISDSVLSQVNSKINKPMIVVNRKSNLSMDSVIPDSVQGAERAVVLCIKLGYEKFILGRNTLFSSLSIERTDAFRNKLEISGIAEEMIHEFEYNITPYEETIKKIDALLDSKRKILIFAPTDAFARALADDFAQRGITLGDRVGILGFEGMGYATMNTPHVTTVNIHPEKIGQKAVDILIARINGENIESASNYVVQSTFNMGDTL